MKLPHYGQIVTTRKTIEMFAYDIELPIIDNTVAVIINGLDCHDSLMRLYATCARLYYLSRLVYRGKSGISKLSSKRYRELIFDPHAETSEEIVDSIERMRKSGVIVKQNNNDYCGTKTIRCFNIIEELWCGAISCVNEQIYIPELAYAMEYVVKNNGELPMPVFSDYSPFPSNYENYHYTDGIAVVFDKVMDLMI